MICVTIQNRNLDGIVSILERPEVRMAEIRLDSCDLSEEDIEYLFSCSDKPLVATFRGEYDEDAERALALAAASGAAYIDLDVDAPAPMGKRLRRAALESGTVMIRSFHDWCGTPELEELTRIAQTCRRFGGEVVKIVTTAAGPQDWQTLRRLYESFGRLIAFCMGSEDDSRLECLALGAPFTYASPEDGEEAAPGQKSVRAMNEAVYSGRPAFDRSALVPPVSKSFAQRAIMAAALAEGTSHLGGYTSCEDNEAAIRAARVLGAEVTRVDDMLVISGIGSKSPAVKEISAGESGLLARLLIPLMAALSQETTVRLTGEKTLLKRPLSDANDIMAPFGVVLTPAVAADVQGRAGKEIHVPLDINGKLLPGKAEISGAAGSQLISGLLMALPLLAKPSMVYVQEPKSIPYMFITLDVLRRFGVNISNEMEGDEDFLQRQDWSHCSATSFKIKGGQSLRAADIDLEKDWSAAANFLVAGAIFGSVSVDGLDERSLQADISIIDILVDVGAMASQDESGRINVARAPLTAIDVDLSNSPDLFPIVSVLAAFCSGESRLKGAGRLIHKESDRAGAIISTLEKMGVSARLEGDVIVIDGMSLEQRILTGRLLRGGEYPSFHDHRMVMALKVASLGADGPVVIDDEACVAKSYPGFFENWK